MQYASNFCHPVVPDGFIDLSKTISFDSFINHIAHRIHLSSRASHAKTPLFVLCKKCRSSIKKRNGFIADTILKCAIFRTFYKRIVFPSLGLCLTFLTIYGYNKGISRARLTTTQRSTSKCHRIRPITRCCGTRHLSTSRTSTLQAHRHLMKSNIRFSTKYVLR